MTVLGGDHWQRQDGGDVTVLGLLDLSVAFETFSYDILMGLNMGIGSGRHGVVVFLSFLHANGWIFIILPVYFPSFPALN